MRDFVDEETKTYHRAFSPRVLDCPDGIARMVTLQNWSWDALDFIAERDGMDRQAIIDFCWHTAQEHPAGDADYEFAALLAYYIHLYMRRRAQAEGDFANDDGAIVQAEEGNWP
jgi:predicted DNA-binding ribbon-helix-helix protein